MPYVIDSDPDGEYIRRLRAGEAVEIPTVVLTGTEYEVFRRFALLYKPTGDEPAWRMTFDASDGVPRCVGFAADVTDGGREIRTPDLCAINIESLLEMASKWAAFRQVPRSYKEDILSGESLRAVRSARRSARRKVTDELLREVAEIYRREVDNTPTEAVASHLDVADRTARLYVRRARDAGFLGGAIRGKAGER